MKSSIAGYFGSYNAAYESVGKKFKESRMFSIQLGTDYRQHQYVLIYYGNFV